MKHFAFTVAPQNDEDELFADSSKNGAVKILHLHDSRSDGPISPSRSWLRRILQGRKFFFISLLGFD